MAATSSQLYMQSLLEFGIQERAYRPGCHLFMFSFHCFAIPQCGSQLDFSQDSLIKKRDISTMVMHISREHRNSPLGTVKFPAAWRFDVLLILNLRLLFLNCCHCSISIIYKSFPLFILSTSCRKSRVSPYSI